MGKHPYDFIVPKEAQPAVDTVWKHLLEGDETDSNVNENITKDGRTIICEWMNTPLKRPDGTVIGVLSMVQDITERKQTEEVLHDTRESLNRLLNSIVEGAYGVDTNGNCTFVNQSCLQMLGYQNNDELLGKHMHTLMHHSHADGSPHPVSMHFGTPCSRESQYAELSMYFGLYNDDGGMGTLATLHARISKLNIFLDIDGVLCPPSTAVRNGSAYCHFTRFETIMREFPEWKIVISSGLRERLNLDQLRSKFSDDIAERIVGVTPVIGMSIPQCRQHEIERYLLNADQALFPWIALDDMADQFVRGLSNLVLCDMNIGLDDCMEVELRARLAAHELASPHCFQGSIDSTGIEARC